MFERRHFCSFRCFFCAGKGVDQSGPDGETAVRVHLVCAEGLQNRQVFCVVLIETVTAGAHTVLQHSSWLNQITANILCVCVDRRRFYEEGAIMLGEEAGLLADTLIGLNTIDFRCVSPCFLFII